MPFVIRFHCRFPVKCCITDNGRPFSKLLRAYLWETWFTIALLTLRSESAYASG